MSTLLYVESSPRKERAYSIAVARRFLEVYGQTHPDDTVRTIDLWDGSLPEFDGNMIAAKYAVMHGESTIDAQRVAWETVKKIFDDFNDADKYLIGLPMWNFGIPYKLKQYIDLITQPGMAFNVRPEGGYEGLVTDRPAIAIYARGGAYEAGTGAEGYDFQSPYLNTWLQFIGFTQIESIAVEPTLGGGPDKAQQAKRGALARAEELAKTF